MLDSSGQRYSPAGKEKQAELNRLAQQEIGLQKALGEARAKSVQVGTDAINRFVEANAVGADKVRVKQTQLLNEFSQAIAKTGGVLDLNNATHKRAYDALNASLAEVGKTTKAAGGSARSAKVTSRPSPRLPPSTPPS